MNRFVYNGRTQGKRVPRTRGDEPVIDDERDVTVLEFPAHAGMNRNLTRPSTGRD